MWPTEHVCTSWTIVPQRIIEKYGEVTLAVDLMAVNKIPLMIMTSRDTFRGCWVHMQQDKSTLMTSIAQVPWTYKARGFWICNILADGSFECIRNGLSEMGIALNIASRNKYVPKIEWYIMTVKEWVKAITNTLPFKRYPPRLIAEMVSNILFLLNSFLHNDRVNMAISPRNLIIELAIDYNKHCLIAFGTTCRYMRKGTTP